MSHAHKAVELFEEVIKIHVDARKDPEKYNLYAGLIAMAKGIRELEQKVDALKR